MIKKTKQGSCQLIINKKEVAEEFKMYFDKLLNNTTTRTDNYINIQYSSVEPYYISIPSRSEINTSINKLKNDKSPGENNIVAKLLKNGGEAVENEIWTMIKIIWEKQQILPEEWNTAMI